jgi:hypothetical protein
MFASLPEPAYADETGVSYWLPGRFSSLAATPQVPGWSMAAVYSHTGFLFPVGDMQGYLNLKGYGEFEAANRPSGWNTWLTLSISPMAPASTVTPTRRIVTK